jgi:HD-like signal output (HDOD) protein
VTQVKRLSNAMDRLEHLPPFPEVTVELMRLLGRDCADFRKVASLISQDAAMSAEVLRMANSPLYAGRNVSNVLTAITLIGVDRLSSLVTTLSLHQMVAPVVKLQAFRLAFRHNLACALVCERFAEFQCVSPQTAYTAGLLHDLGSLAMLVLYREAYSAALMQATSAQEFVAEERERFGFTHTQAGFALVQLWKLPEFLEMVTLDHHEPGPATGLSGLVRVAVATVDALGFAPFGASGPSDGCPFLPGTPPQTDPNQLEMSLTEGVNRLELEFAMAA